MEPVVIGRIVLKRKSGIGNASNAIVAALNCQAESLFLAAVTVIFDSFVRAYSPLEERSSLLGAPGKRQYHG